MYLSIMARHCLLSVLFLLNTGIQRAIAQGAAPGDVTGEQIAQADQGVSKVSHKLTAPVTGDNYICSCDCCESVRKLPGDPVVGSNLTAEFKCAARLDQGIQSEDKTHLVCPEMCSVEGSEGGIKELTESMVGQGAMTTMFCMYGCSASQGEDPGSTCSVRPEAYEPGYIAPADSPADACADDPDGIVASQGMDCREFADDGCNMLEFNLAGKTYNVFELCPKTCGKCEANAMLGNGGDAPVVQTNNAGPAAFSPVGAVLPMPTGPPLDQVAVQSSIASATLSAEANARAAEAAAAAARKKVMDFDPVAAAEALKPADWTVLAGPAPAAAPGGAAPAPAALVSVRRLRAR